LEELSQGSLHLGRENRHCEDVVAMTCNRGSEEGVCKDVVGVVVVVVEGGGGISDAGLVGIFFGRLTIVDETED
jgi:hypothetical protein